MPVVSEPVIHHYFPVYRDDEDVFFWYLKPGVAEELRKSVEGARLYKGYWRGEARQWVDEHGYVRKEYAEKWCECMKNVYFDNLDEQSMIQKIANDEHGNHYNPDRDWFRKGWTDTTIAVALREHRAKHPIPTSADTVKDLDAAPTLPIEAGVDTITSQGTSRDGRSSLAAPSQASLDTNANTAEPMDLAAPTAKPISHYFPISKSDFDRIGSLRKSQRELLKTKEPALWRGYWRKKAKRIEIDELVGSDMPDVWCLFMQRVYFDNAKEQAMIKLISKDIDGKHYKPDFDAFAEGFENTDIAKALRIHRASHTIPTSAPAVSEVAPKHAEDISSPSPSNASADSHHSAEDDTAPYDNTNIDNPSLDPSFASSILKFTAASIGTNNSGVESVEEKET